MRLLITLALFFFAIQVASAQKPALAIKLSAPADANGDATFDLVDTENNKIVTGRYKVDEGIIEFYKGAEFTGSMEMTPNTFKIYIGDLQPGESMRISTMKLTDLVNATVVYMTNVEVPLTQQ